VTQFINMHEAKTRLSQLVAAAHEGEDIVIARAGTPVAKLVAYSEPAHTGRIGSMRGLIPILTEQEWEETDRAIAHLWEQ